MGRKRLVFVLLVLGALVLAGAAYATNGGIEPESPVTPNGRRITHAYWFVFAFTAAIFVIVEGALVAFVIKYRSRGRPRTAEGLELHGNTRLELIWSVIPVLILAAIAGFIFANLPGIASVPAASNRIDVRVIGHQFYWEFRYPGGQVGINSLHVPANRVVYLRISSADVDHSWWIPHLGGKTDAIPGRTNHTWFDVEVPGTYVGQCAELCGAFHAQMKQRVVATDEGTYRSYLASAPGSLGRELFGGVCVTCHGLGGKGGYGPPLKGNPLVEQPGGIASIVKNGRVGTIGVMPPVGRGWTNAEIKALTDYLKKNLGSSSGG